MEAGEQTRTPLTRRDFLKSTGAGTLAAGIGVNIIVPGRAHAAKTLKLLQWAHFVPRYDKEWFDSFAKRWGEANAVHVTVDHIQESQRHGRPMLAPVPIVFTLVGDPVAAGIVERLARPGRNVTGVSSLTTELVPKRLEALKSLVPATRRVWAIYHAADPSSLAAVQKAREVAPLLQLEVVSRPVRTPGELDQAP